MPGENHLLTGDALRRRGAHLLRKGRCTHGNPISFAIKRTVGNGRQSRGSAEPLSRSQRAGAREPDPHIPLPADPRRRPHDGRRPAVGETGSLPSRPRPQASSAGFLADIVPRFPGPVDDRGALVGPDLGRSDEPGRNRWFRPALCAGIVPETYVAGIFMQEADQPFSRNWRWTLASGLFTALLAVMAFLLPAIEWMPRGGLVGWLLFLTGICELTFGWKRGLDTVGKTAVGSGLVTAVAGLLFIANPLAGYFPVANVVMAWLLLRGAWVLAMALRVRDSRLGKWLAFGGAVDILLGFALLVGVPVATLVVGLFGPTREIVANFALILAASFAATGISQVGIALVQRTKSPIAS